MNKVFWFYTVLSNLPDDIVKYVRVMDETHKELWTAMLNEDEFKMFINIMKNNKHALLNRRHEVFSEVCNLKLRYGKRIIYGK
jgi:hypothetical protein